MNEELRKHLVDLGCKITTLSKDDLRSYLKSKGWRRSDRTSQGESEELWICPWDDKVYEPLGISLRSAIKKQLKKDGFRTS
jgi:hypothetical protein